MHPLKPGQEALRRLLSAVFSYSEIISPAQSPAEREHAGRPPASMLVVEQLNDSGHVEITELLVDRPLEHIPDGADSRHRGISSCGFHRVAKVLFQELYRKLCLKVTAQHRFRITGKVRIPHRCRRHRS